MKSNRRNGKPVKVHAPAESPDRREGAAGERAARRQHGKELRRVCPRSSHAHTALGQRLYDPISLLEESDKDRVEKLLPIRFTRMAESPFAFFRGSAILQAHDLKATPSPGIVVQCCGDCHLMNFGGFATPERTLIFDINDFDETHPGPFEWDVKRLTVSFVLAARWLGFTDNDARRAVAAVVGAYRTAIAQATEMSVLETWYGKITIEDMLEEFSADPKILKLLKKSVEKASHNTCEHIFHKITHVTNGKPRIADQPPLLFHADPTELDVERDVQPFFKTYRRTLSRDHQVLFDRFQVVDAAHKVVGVGSVGTRCFIALFCGNQDDHLFLQVKEARPSVLEGLAGHSPFANNGERVVVGQRLMQAASDIFLGWSRGPHDRDYYIRQLRDMKIAPDLTGYTPTILAAYGHLCGRTLGRAHGKSGDAATIMGYLGPSTVFDKAIVAYALAYADQVEQDYEIFRAATRTGRFPIETLPSELEQAIR